MQIYFAHVYIITHYIVDVACFYVNFNVMNRQLLIWIFNILACLLYLYILGITYFHREEYKVYIIIYLVTYLHIIMYYTFYRLQLAYSVKFYSCVE